MAPLQALAASIELNGSAAAIRGTRLVAVPQHRDERGCLIALDHGQSLPFEVRRVFCIYPGHPKAIRAEHATSAHCGLLALQGAVDVDLDNGDEVATIRLATTDQALCVHAGVWLRLRNFTGDAILMIAASEPYAESVYYDHPNPELIRDVPRHHWR